MVTIEQKLSMFSKLLHRSMGEKFAEEMEVLKKEYEVKIQKSKDAVDKEAEDILSLSRKKAEAEAVELTSKNRVSMKREYMAVKEKQYAALMTHLKGEIALFTQTEKYREYVSSLVKKLEELGEFSNSLIIYLTNRDHEKYAPYIHAELMKSQQKNLSFRIADDTILGGFIVEDPVRNIRMDFSIEALLEENKTTIMQKLFQAIEAGEANGI